MRLVALALGVACAFPRPAEAAPRVQGVGEVAIGYTDNVQSAPDAPGPGVQPKEDGVFALVRPGVVIAIATPRHVQHLTYTYTYELVVTRTEASTSSNQLGYAAFIDLAPTAGLVLGANVVQSNFSSALLVSPPGAGAVNAVPTGTGSFLSGTASELLSLELAPAWRAYDEVSVSAQSPLFETVAPRTYGTGGRLGLERTWEADAAGLEARADYSVISGSVRLDGSPLGDQRQLVGAGVASWRHDWGRWITSRAEAGVLRVQRLESGRGIWAPTGAAAVAYAADPGDAELRYSRTVTTNLLLGQVLLVDEIGLRGGVPLTGKGDVLVAGTAGYQQGHLLGEDARRIARVDVVVLDVGIGYRVVPPLLLGIRYQHLEQSSDVALPPLPSSFVRNSVLLGATVRLPPDSEMPAAHRAPRRVDGTDEVRGTVGEPAAGSRTESAPARNR